MEDDTYVDDYPGSDRMLYFAIEIEKTSHEGWDIIITHPDATEERVKLKVWANAADWIGERIMVMADAMERARPRS